MEDEGIIIPVKPIQPQLPPSRSHSTTQPPPQFFNATHNTNNPFQSISSHNTSTNSTVPAITYSSNNTYGDGPVRKRSVFENQYTIEKPPAVVSSQPIEFLHTFSVI